VNTFFRVLRTPVKATALAALLALSACSTINEVTSGDKVDYKSGGRHSTPALDIPPDLTKLSSEPRYAVPGTQETATGFQSSKVNSNQGATPTAVTTLGDVRVERDGNQRWLVVARSPEALWEPVRAFWLANGFQLAIDDAKLGILETEYAENRAKLPQDIVRRTLGRILDSFYSTGERDKFRTRLELRSDGRTEIYISHRGMVEVITNANGLTGNTVWQTRPTDPELETEFLRRLMVQLGASQAQAATAMPPAVAPSAQVTQVDGRPALQIPDSFDRAWRRVGLSLDRTGFTVEDRDRTQGVYFVRYVNPTTEDKDKGFFSRIFDKGSAPAPLKYRIALKSEGSGVTVTVLNADGQADTSANAKRIVQVLADDLK